MKEAIICLSGGMDSATVLALALSSKLKCIGVGFSYGSKHNVFENQKAKELAEHYDIPFTLINIENIISGFFRSNLLLSGGDIPEGHYESENMKSTVVPGRNLIFISILAGLAESIGVPEIWMGIHAGDHHIYPDCRPEFFYSTKDTVAKSTEGKVTLVAPFLHKTKADIVARGISLGVPYKLTRTCYKNQEVACGKCGSCQERLEAFLINKTKDPIPYEGSNNE